MKKEIIPLPYSYYWWPVFILSLAGLADSIYLVYSHFRVFTDIEYSSFCAISKSLNCDTVSQSIYSILLGVPVPVWGAIGYLFLIVCVILAKSETKMWSIIFLVSLCYSFYQIYLGYVSYKYIHSFCLMCFVSYGISFAVAYFAWLIIRRFFPIKPFLYPIYFGYQYIRNNLKKTASISIIFIIIIFSVYLFFPSYWNIKPPDINTEINTGLTEDGNPWIGAQKPDLTITEFTDYECFQCKKMHQYLRKLVNLYPQKIRLIHRHYPMDYKFNKIVLKRGYHYAAGYLALIAVYATEKGDFWRVNDILYKLERDSRLNLTQISGKTGYSVEELKSAFTNARIRGKLKLDIWQGAKLRITGTPSYIIEGKIYDGVIPGKILKKIMEE